MKTTLKYDNSTHYLFERDSNSKTCSKSCVKAGLLGMQMKHWHVQKLG